MQRVPFVKEAKNGQTKVNQLPDMLHTALSGIAAGSQAIGVLSMASFDAYVHAGLALANG